MSYEVTAGTGPATGATLDAGPASPQSAGTAITLSAAGIGGSGIYEYQFYIKGPSDTAAKIVQPYSSVDTYQWTPASGGIYSLGVRVRGQGSTADFEAQKWMSYEVTAGTGPATGATLDAGPSLPAGGRHRDNAQRRGNRRQRHLRVPVLHQGSQRHGSEDRSALLERRHLPVDPCERRDLLSGRAGENPGLDGRLRGPEVDAMYG